MSCTSSYGNYDAHKEASQTVGDKPGSASSTGGKKLIVSDSLETITAIPMQDKWDGTGGTTYNLWTVQISVSSTPLGVRLFGWHVNKLASGGDMYILVAASVDSGTCEIQDFVVRDDATSDIGTMGTCLAKAQLFQDFPSPISKSDITTTEAIIWSKRASINQTVGVVMQFTLVSDAPRVVKLRVLANTSDSLQGSFADALAAFDPLKPHVHGTWDVSQANFPWSPPFDAVPPSPEPRVLRVGICKGGGPEEDVWPAGGDNLVNKGEYGANLFYDFTITNSNETGPSLPVYVYLESTSNTVPKYFGAANAKVVWPDDSVTTFTPRGVPVLEHVAGPGSTASDHFVRLTSTPGPPEAEAPIYLAPGVTAHLTVQIANAGGAALPANIVLSTAAITPLE